MNIKVGKFQGYVPDRDPAEIILSILSEATRDDTQQEKCISPAFLQNFLYNAKKKAAELMQDINFSESSFAPHSKEIDVALHDLQGAGFLIRPNPVYSPFKVEAKHLKDPSWMDSEHKKMILEIAEDLKDALGRS